MPVEDKEPTPDELFMGIYGGDLLLPDELTTPGALRSSAEAFEMDLISELSGGGGPDSARKQGPNPFAKARGEVAGGKIAQEKIDQLVRRVNACWLVNLSNCEANNRFRADVAEMKKELAAVKEAVKEVRQMDRPSWGMPGHVGLRSSHCRPRLGVSTGFCGSQGLVLEKQGVGVKVSQSVSQSD